MTEQVKKLMKTLNVSEQEAMEIINADKEIDRLIHNARAFYFI